MNGSTAYEATGNPEQVGILWSARKVDGKATVMMKNNESDIFIPSDAAVPISRVADLIVFSYKQLDDANMVGSVCAHVGDGNLHVKIICEKERENIGRKIIETIEFEAVKMEGTVTGEHGIGLKLRDALVEELGQSAVDMMRKLGVYPAACPAMSLSEITGTSKIKLALDPFGILNCDKVIRLNADIPSTSDKFDNGEAALALHSSEKLTSNGTAGRE